jgi:hypothetical protein
MFLKEGHEVVSGKKCMDILIIIHEWVKNIIPNEVLPFFPVSRLLLVWGCDFNSVRRHPCMSSSNIKIFYPNCTTIWSSFVYVPWNLLCTISDGPFCQL